MSRQLKYPKVADPHVAQWRATNHSPYNVTVAWRNQTWTLGRFGGTLAFALREGDEIPQIDAVSRGLLAADEIVIELTDLFDIVENDFNI